MTDIQIIQIIGFITIAFCIFQLCIQDSKANIIVHAFCLGAWVIMLILTFLIKTTTTGVS